MRSGKMAHVISIERSSTTVNDVGTPTLSWAAVATLRAELVERSTEEFLRGAGDTSETTIVFRTRFVDGVTTEDRVSFAETAYDIEEIVSIGRRKGLELRCKEVTP